MGSLSSSLYLTYLLELCVKSLVSCLKQDNDFRHNYRATGPLCLLATEIVILTVLQIKGALPSSSYEAAGFHSLSCPSEALTLTELKEDGNSLKQEPHRLVFLSAIHHFSVCCVPLVSFIIWNGFLNLK